MHQNASKPPSNRPSNHLRGESSPYLREHIYNEVDWYPYGSVAFDKAKTEDKPIFLSIGYSSCHWCHVMRRESFEKGVVARFLNDHFISIKVDREERPDLDHFYQSAVQLMGRSGGWPLSVFMTPNRKIFFGGTYFPPTTKYGMLGFPEILAKLIQLYETHRADLESSGDEIHDVLTKIFNNTVEKKPAQEIPMDIQELNSTTMHQIVEKFLKTMDSLNGGFGAAPKFPMFPALVFLMRQYQESQIHIPGDNHQFSLDPNRKQELLQLVEKALDAMGNGGIYDHIGGGFARYAVDDHWEVPHFEKMLYDNAMALVAYSEAYQLYKKPRYKAIVQGIIEWAQREMWHSNHGFHSTLNADSDGEEGKYYVWTESELDQLLSKDEKLLFSTAYNVTTKGNFEDGKIVLNRLHSDTELASLFHLEEQLITQRLHTIHARLLHERQTRVPPEKDDKTITAWNALFVHGLAAAYNIFQDEEYGKIIYQFIIETNDLLRKRMYNPTERRLYRIYHEGQVKVAGMLEDYAYFLQALWDEFEITHDYEIVAFINELTQITEERFGNPENTDFYFAEKTDDLPISPKIAGDMPLPNPSAVLAETFLQAFYYLGDQQMQNRAEKYLTHEFPNAMTHPMDHATFWLTVQWALYGPVEIGEFLPKDVPISSGNDLWRQTISDLYIPRLHHFIGTVADPKLISFAGKTSQENLLTFSICFHFNCHPYFTESHEMHNFLIQHFPSKTK